MKAIKLLTLIASVTVCSTGASSEETGDPQRGMQVFKKCSSCHMVGVKARNRVGPPLNNIMSARAGGVANFKYSKALKKVAADGLHWDVQSLDAYIKDPKGFLPKTKMSFRGLKDEADRTDLIAYLATFSGGALAAKVDEGFTVSNEILSLEGDVEYGEYLSSECTTCHQADGNNDGIPGIVGWEKSDFVTAMHAYREKQRENPVMQLVTGRLSNEEIAALAEYFNGLNQDN